MFSGYVYRIYAILGRLLQVSISSLASDFYAMQAVRNIESLYASEKGNEAKEIELPIDS